LVNVLISVDMEGIAGIASMTHCEPGGLDYPTSRALMTSEANAAVEGAFEGGATSVVVNDSHGANSCGNLLIEQLDQRAQYIVGSPKPLVMMQGLSAEIGVVLFVGYHAGSGAPAGVLSHTISDFAEVRVCGHPVTEAEVNALIAASDGVPVGLVTGDDVICAVSEKALPGVITVPVKTAIGRNAARSLHPALARDKVRAGASRAVTAALAGALQPISLPDELILEVDLRPPGAAEIAILVPGTERIGPDTVRRRIASPREMIDVIMLWAQLTSDPGR
jgi:D-amino peptidase